MSIEPESSVGGCDPAAEWYGIMELTEFGEFFEAAQAGSAGSATTQAQTRELSTVSPEPASLEGGRGGWRDGRGCACGHCSCSSRLRWRSEPMA